MAAATVCARQQVLQPQQWRQPSSYGFATSAAVQQAAAAPAAAAAAAGPCAVPAAAAQLPDVYVPLDSPITEKYSVAPKRVFAVVEVGGTQYKVTPNDVIVVEKLAGVDVNDRLQLRRVLLLGSQAETIIGRPYVPDACVTAAVEVRRGRVPGLGCEGRGGEAGRTPVAVVARRAGAWQQCRSTLACVRLPAL